MITLIFKKVVLLLMMIKNHAFIMRIFDFDWQSQDALKLCGQGYLPRQHPCAIICLVHGFAEHMGRYQEVATYFANKNIGLMAFDTRGHGRSQGKRGDTKSYEYLMQDIDNFTALIASKFQDIPLFLYGHSMGGNQVINFLVDRQNSPFKGLIVTSPWLRLPQLSPKLALLLGQIFSIIMPNYTQKVNFDVTELSRDSAIGRHYRSDPLVHRCITVRMFKEITKYGERAINRAHQLNTPLLLMHGGADKITSFKASRLFFENVTAPKTFVPYANCRHELHHETNRAEVLDRIATWIVSML